MRAGYTISAIGHCLVLGYSLYSYSAKPFDIAPMDSVAADVISEREFSQLMNGSKTAPKVAKPLPVVDKIGEARNIVPDPAPKVTEKPEIKVETPPAASPPPKPPDVKPPETKPTPAAAMADPKPEPDPIAEALKREEAKKKEEAKKEEAKKREEAKREEAKRREEARKREENKFDVDKIQTALLDKRAPQRQAATGSVINPTPSLGSPTANAPELSQNEIDALRAQLMSCWNPPVGVAEAKDLVVVVKFSLNRDGSVSGEPTVVNRAAHALFQIAAESATRAVRRCQPFRLPASKYEAWRDVEVKFDPNEMFRG